MKVFFGALLLLLLVAAAGTSWVWAQINRPYKGFDNEVFIDFPVHTRTEQMGRLLAAKGVLREPWLFMAARVFAPRPALQAGEYRFSEPASPLDVLRRIARGDTFYEVLTVPEGQNIFEIAQDLKVFQLISPESFLNAARDPTMIRDLDPAAPSLEGYLFPDSYRIDKRSTARSLCRTMTHRFREEWKTLATTAGVHDVITLASLVEREAKLPAERPLVASVFRNRLRIDMNLDCDPTTVYAALLEHRYRGTIYRSDLENPNPYNTYRHPGLPPGPIANPGLSSIKAAISPANTGFLYFAAKTDGSGGHNFSDNLRAHLAAAALLRAAERNQSRSR